MNNIINKYPIIIPFKATSVRCPQKNFILYPIVFEWLMRIGVDYKNIYVVSASKEVENFISYSNVNFVYESETSNDSSAVLMNVVNVIDSPIYIHLPLTQPLRNGKIIEDVVQKIENSTYDFVTTYQHYTDRNIFFLNDDLSSFVTPSVNRKGSMCATHPMIDGAIYAIKKEFILKLNYSENQNATFWGGKFYAIKNDVPFFIDVDDKSDLNKFRALPQLMF